MTGSFLDPFILGALRHSLCVPSDQREVGIGPWPTIPPGQPLILPGQWQEVQNLAVKMFEEAPADRDLRK